MSKFDSTAFIAKLREKWGSRPCPMCEKGPWNVSDSTFQLMEYSQGGLHIGGPVIPIVPVTCGNCGHTILVNAIVSGVVSPSPPAAKVDAK